MSGVRAVPRSSRVQLLLIGGAIALAFLLGAAKASAAGDPVNPSTTSGDAGTIVVAPDNGGVSHIDPYGKG